MAGVLWYDGPLPEIAGDYWCTLCAMLYKGFANNTELAKDAIAATNAMSDREHRTLIIRGMEDLMPGRKEPEPAVAIMISPLVQQIVGQLMGLPLGMVAPPIPVPLCWTHLTGLQLQPGGKVVPATADQMPGGQAGAVDLSRRRGG